MHQKKVVRSILVSAVRRVLLSNGKSSECNVSVPHRLSVVVRNGTCHVEMMGRCKEKEGKKKENRWTLRTLSRVQDKFHRLNHRPNRCSSIEIVRDLNGTHAAAQKTTKNNKNFQQRSSSWLASKLT